MITFKDKVVVVYKFIMDIDIIFLKQNSPGMKQFHINCQQILHNLQYNILFSGSFSKQSLKSCDLSLIRIKSCAHVSLYSPLNLHFFCIRHPSSAMLCVYGSAIENVVYEILDKKRGTLQNPNRISLSFIYLFDIC